MGAELSPAKNGGATVAVVSKGSVASNIVNRNVEILVPGFRRFNGWMKFQ
jgi:hypothetical protein